ncbi:hypothetical protein DPMN_171278 [Dreissena polymorpha]|uniref:Uncharacterized protein n=1 Tax=Dreissena polymorpha TaxID=45954 RepID=A0A9D4IE08_DREPO|nr:hypothetical protein DPMN_171278 [Dreissena polymorpha]
MFRTATIEDQAGRVEEALGIGRSGYMSAAPNVSSLLEKHRRSSSSNIPCIHHV